MIEYKKVDKRLVRRKIKEHEKFIEVSKEYCRFLKNNECFKWGMKYELKKEIEEKEEDLKNYREQLTCKHEHTKKIETEDHHNGDIDTEIVCTKCKFQLAYY